MEQTSQDNRDDLRLILQKVETIEFNLEAAISMLKYLSQAHNSNHFNNTMALCIKKGHIDVKNVRELTNLTKTQCHNILDKLSTYPGFSRQKGNEHYGGKIRVKYSTADEERALNQIKCAVDEKKFLPLKDIISMFNMKTIGDSRKVAEQFCEKYNEYFVDESRYESKPKPTILEDIGLSKIRVKNEVNSC